MCSPGDSGIPRDPIHARSKRLSLLALLAVGFGLAVGELQRKWRCTPAPRHPRCAALLLHLAVSRLLALPDTFPDTLPHLPPLSPRRG